MATTIKRGYDQMVRELADNYDEWVRNYEMCDYEWDVGIAP